MKVVAVSKSASHHFSKELYDSISLIEGMGVEGDCHFGKTVQHRSRVAVDPTQPNLRQVHLIHSELLEELESVGHTVSSGELGENVLTRGIDLLDLPKGTRVKLGEHAVVEITGLRNPCQQVEDFQGGLLSKVAFKDNNGIIIRKTGVMGIVLVSGSIRPEDKIEVELPPLPHLALEKV